MRPALFLTLLLTATHAGSAMAATPAGASAQPAAASLTPQQASQCNEIASLAQAIMAARQKGVPMAQVVDTLKQSGAGALLGPMQSIAQDAYSRPQPATEIERQKAVQDFRTEAHASCMRAQQGKAPARR